MKASNIATVVMIATITTIVAAIVVNALLGDPNDESVSITYMDVVSADVSEPNPEVFNAEAVNPTVEVYVGDCKTGERWDESSQQCVDEQNTEEDVSTDEETDQGIFGETGE